ncbi:CTD phosphatase Fcp1 [Coemansia sp. RSA 2322]|nr:CTD phosphatase Fcp1 [Coemansia sp. RSA 2322]
MESTNGVSVPQQHVPATVVEIKVSTGDLVAKQAPLLIYEHKVKYDPNLHLDMLNKLKKKVDSSGYFSKREMLRSPYEGKVASLSCASGDVVGYSDVLVEITVPCGHGAVFNGLCGLCGKDVSNVDTSGIPDSQANIDMFHGATGLKVSYEVAANIDADTRQSLWNQKKLSLIIDLDQTIIHARDTRDPQFESWLIANYNGPPSASSKGKESAETESPSSSTPSLPSDVGSFYLPEGPERYFIKLRPGLRDFLERVSQLYEMHIYTMGIRSYANAVAALIDPEQRYFNGRILSRDDSGSVTRKTLKRLFPIDTSMVAILDDRADVWEWSPNLIKVRPYEFFRGVGDINAGLLPAAQRTEPVSPDAPSPSLAQAEEKLSTSPSATSSTGNHPRDSNDPLVQAERNVEANGQPGSPSDGRPLLIDNDCELETIQTVLTQLHKKYYSVLDASRSPPLPDTAQLLARNRRQILGGITIVFTAAFPINQGAPPPHKNDLWQWAQSFGARCELEINERTTHVVAGKPGTEKVHAARRLRGNRSNANERGPPIVVKTNWLLESIGRWERLNETPYLWYSEDKDVVSRARQHQISNSSTSSSPHKRKDNDGFLSVQDPKHPRRQVSAIRRLKAQQQDQEAGDFDSTNTTDIEDELERQEAGLEEHEAEVNDFVKSIDWDDLEREAMEGSDSDDYGDSDDDDDDHSQPSSPGGSGNGPKSHSRMSSLSNLRTSALRQAALQRNPTKDSQHRSEITNDIQTDSSDVYADSSSECSGGSENEGGEDDIGGVLAAAERHRMKRRKTSPDTAKRRSKLAVHDGSLDIGTNTEDTDDSDSGSASAVANDLESALGGHPNGGRQRLASRLGISPNQQSILDRDNDRGDDDDDDDDDDDANFEDDVHQADAALFAGIEDRPVATLGNVVGGGDDDSQFEDTDGGHSSKGPSGIDNGDSGESEQWGEDDDDDDENFDDLINNLEEEISST